VRFIYCSTCALNLLGTSAPACDRPSDVQLTIAPERAWTIADDVRVTIANATIVKQAFQGRSFNECERSVLVGSPLSLRPWSVTSAEGYSDVLGGVISDIQSIQNTGMVQSDAGIFQDSDYTMSLIRAGLRTLESRRDQLSKRFFQRSVLPESSCLHYLLPDKLSLRECDIHETLKL